jgi:hypothetical protein
MARFFAGILDGPDRKDERIKNNCNISTRFIV